MTTTFKFLLTLLAITSLQIGCSSEESTEDKQNGILDAVVGEYTLKETDVATHQDEAGVTTCTEMRVNLSRGPTTLNIDEVDYKCEGITTRDFRPLTLTLSETTLMQGNKEVGSMTEKGFSVTINTDYKISLVLNDTTKKHVFVLNNVLNNKAYKLNGDLTKQ